MSRNYNQNSYGSGSYGGGYGVGYGGGYGNGYGGRGRGRFTPNFRITDGVLPPQESGRLTRDIREERDQGPTVPTPEEHQREGISFWGDEIKLTGQKQVALSNVERQFAQESSQVVDFLHQTSQSNQVQFNTDFRPVHGGDPLTGIVATMHLGRYTVEYVDRSKKAAKRMAAAVLCKYILPDDFNRFFEAHTGESAVSGAPHFSSGNIGGYGTGGLGGYGEMGYGHRGYGQNYGSQGGPVIRTDQRTTVMEVVGNSGTIIVRQEKRPDEYPLFSVDAETYFARLQASEALCEDRWRQVVSNFVWKVSSSFPLYRKVKVVDNHFGEIIFGDKFRDLRLQCEIATTNIYSAKAATITAFEFLLMWKRGEVEDVTDVPVGENQKPHIHFLVVDGLAGKFVPKGVRARSTGNTPGGDALTQLFDLCLDLRVARMPELVTTYRGDRFVVSGSAAVRNDEDVYQGQGDGPTGKAALERFAESMLSVLPRPRGSTRDIRQSRQKIVEPASDEDNPSRRDPDRQGRRSEKFFDRDESRGRADERDTEGAARWTEERDEGSRAGRSFRDRSTTGLGRRAAHDERHPEGPLTSRMCRAEPNESDDGRGGLSYRVESCRKVDDRLGSPSARDPDDQMPGRDSYEDPFDRRSGAERTGTGGSRLLERPGDGYREGLGKGGGRNRNGSEEDGFRRDHHQERPNERGRQDEDFTRDRYDERVDGLGRQGRAFNIDRYHEREDGRGRRGGKTSGSRYEEHSQERKESGGGRYEARDDKLDQHGRESSRAHHGASRIERSQGWDDFGRGRHDKREDERGRRAEGPVRGRHNEGRDDRSLLGRSYESRERQSAHDRGLAEEPGQTGSIHGPEARGAGGPKYLSPEDRQFERGEELEPRSHDREGMEREDGGNRYGSARGGRSPYATEREPGGHPRDLRRDWRELEGKSDGYGDKRRVDTGRPGPEGCSRYEERGGDRDLVQEHGIGGRHDSERNGSSHFGDDRYGGVGGKDSGMGSMGGREPPAKDGGSGSRLGHRGGLQLGEADERAGSGTGGRASLGDSGGRYRRLREDGDDVDGQDHGGGRGGGFGSSSGGFRGSGFRGGIRGGRGRGYGYGSRF